MATIMLCRDAAYAPCCYIIAREKEPGVFDTRDEGNTVLIQTDWDYPSVATTFGAGKFLGTATEEIAAAQEWLAENVGTTAADPGYFAE